MKHKHTASSLPVLQAVSLVRPQITFFNKSQSKIFLNGLLLEGYKTKIGSRMLTMGEHVGIGDVVKWVSFG